MAGTELAKAYVQIVPSANGIKGQLEKILGKELPPAGEESGKKVGNSLGSTIKKVIAAAGIGVALKKAITEGANLEQSLGGIETLFKNSSDKVIANAKKAYMTSGLSANAYMESVTSFSASLLQGLAGDTGKAADIADMAMVDMSDNANKMGTDMQSIQNAYQGFAKQNYTMLDNLKLGYGGTKTEMERLLADAQKVTGVKYDLSNLSDVYSAIHVIQGELDITGTTAKEAATTLSGSMASMKAAFSNVLGSLAIGEDIKPALNGLIDTVKTFLINNLLPMVGNILTGIVGILPDIMSALMSMVPDILSSIINIITMIIQQISNMAPDILIQIPQLINQIIYALIEGIPSLIKAAIQFFMSIVKAIPVILDSLLENIGEIINEVIYGLISAIPDLIQGAIQFFQAILQAMPVIIEELNKQLPWIITTIVEGLLNGMEALVQAGLQLFGALIKALPDIIKMQIKFTSMIIEGIIKGLSDAIPKLISYIGNIFAMWWDFITDIFSPLTNWFNDNIIQPVISFFKGLWDKVVEIWEGIKNTISFAFQLIANIISAAFQIITLPFRFIWENCKEYVFAVFDAIKEFINNTINNIKEIITTVLNAIKTAWNTVWTAIKDFLIPIINGIRDFVSTTFNSIKSIITNIINSVKNTVTNVFNAIKNAIFLPLNAAKSSVNNIFDSIRDKIDSVISKAKNIVQKGLDAIKGFFDKLKLKFPDLKLPHFKIDGSFSLSPPSVPKFSIDWYAKAMNKPMVMTSPTAFGVNSLGQIMAGGEKGSEVVSGTDTLMKMIASAVASENGKTNQKMEVLLSLLYQYLPQLANTKIVLDSGKLVGETAPAYDAAFGAMRTQTSRGW